MTMRFQQKAANLNCQKSISRKSYQLYEPLQIYRIERIAPRPMQSCVQLFHDDDEGENNLTPHQQQPPTSLSAKNVLSQNKVLQSDSLLQKIISNSKNSKRLKKQQPKLCQPIQTMAEYENYSFNHTKKLKFSETPHFKDQLQSPFQKFNHRHRVHIDNFQIQTTKCQAKPIDLNSHPLDYIAKPFAYFAGIYANLKEKQCENSARAVLKLALYLQPKNPIVWRKFIESEEQSGFIHKAYICSKTAFLFTQQQQFARSYLSNGQKCEVPLRQMRGILNSIQSPQTLEKTILIQIGKLTLKHGQIWKGLKVLLSVCQQSDFKLPVCSLIIFLAKYLQNNGERDKAIYILEKCLGRGMSKLEVYTTYLEMKIRKQSGQLSTDLLEEILKYVDCISSENRYRLYLQIAQILHLRKDSNYKYFIEQAYLAAYKFCTPGAGCQKTLRHIYCTLLRWKNSPPLKMFPCDSSNFEVNRYTYISQGKLKDYDFSDWKYYLHYGLSRGSDVLLKASKNWSYTGRLVAEWIHSMREDSQPENLLKIWKEKIDQIPKSGQLWCEGGRIYAQLHKYHEASNCFKAAIHFTPQYGDSFIEQLRIVLMKAQFMEAHRLKKMMLVSEPFYGHVWSFLRESTSKTAKPTLIELWEMATREINKSLYKMNINLSRQHTCRSQRLLTAYSPYNEAHANPCTPQIRHKLFVSYEHLENKI